MTHLAFLNIPLAVIGLILIAYALRRLPPRRCGDPIISDALVLVSYLLMINSHYMASKTDYAEVAREAWHLFDLAVIVNIIFHAKSLLDRRSAR